MSRFTKRYQGEGTPPGAAPAGRLSTAAYFATEEHTDIQLYKDLDTLVHWIHAYGELKTLQYFRQRMSDRIGHKENQGVNIDEPSALTRGIIGYSFVGSLLKIAYATKMSDLRPRADRLKNASWFSVSFKVKSHQKVIKRGVREFAVAEGYTHLRVRGTRTTWWWKPGWDPVKQKIVLDFVPVTKTADAERKRTGETSWYASES